MVLRVFRFGCLLLVVACSRLDPAAELAAARIDFESGSFQTASIRLSNVLRADPENAEAHLLRGELALAIGDYELAVNELNRALALGAASDHVAVSLADAAARKGDHELAIGTLESALPGLTGEAGYWLVRADVLTRAGSPDEANAALERAAALGAEGSVSYLIAQGRLAALRGDSARAESLLREAVKQGQTSAEAHQALGDLYSHLNRLTEAAVELAAAADLFRSSGRFWKEVRVLAELVQVQLALNDLDSAERTAARLSEALPEAPMTSYVRGLVEYRQGRFDAAVVSLQKAVAGGPRNSHFLTLLAAAQLAQGNLGQAEQHLLRVLAADPRDPAAIKLLAETRLRQRRPDAALEALSPLAGATTEDAHVGFLTGIATILTGDVERGITYLEQAAALDPGNELLKLELARVYSVVGREAEALELMRGTWGAGGDALLARVLELLSFARAGDTESGERAVTELLAEYPSDERAFLAAALYRQATNQPREARQLLETAVELDRESIRARLLLAAALIQEGRAQDAERHLRDALALAPD